MGNNGGPRHSTNGGKTILKYGRKRGQKKIRGKRVVGWKRRMKTRLMEDYDKTVVG